MGFEVFAQAVEKAATNLIIYGVPYKSPREELIYCFRFTTVSDKSNNCERKWSLIQITDYTTLGRSGLKVSPFCLGTMTFGNYRWGSQDEESREIFRGYIEAGGNFIDTADGYAVGK